MLQLTRLRILRVVVQINSYRCCLLNLLLDDLALHVELSYLGLERHKCLFEHLLFGFLLPNGVACDHCIVGLVKELAYLVGNSVYLLGVYFYLLNYLVQFGNMRGILVVLRFLYLWKHETYLLVWLVEH